MPPGIPARIRTSMSQHPSPASGFLRPLPLAAMVLLAVNDHVLKGSAPGWLTGKLSDVAGMVFFPLLLQAGVELVLDWMGRDWGPSRRLLVGCAVATAVVFGAVQVLPLATDAYRWGLGALQWPVQAVPSYVQGHGLPGLRAVAVTPDPTDLLTTPFVLVAVLLGWRRTE
jgi:hypothetical protein